MQRLRLSLLVMLAAALAGCPAGVRTPPPAAPAPVISPRPATPESAEVRGTTYAVDSLASDVAILVYRGGVLARLGHNHVMTVKSLSGQVMLAADKSSFDLSFPVADLVVDDARARRAAGPEFAGTITQDDRDGTRRNMLKPEVLDGEHFARIALRSLHVTLPLQSAKALTRITIRNVSRDIEVPIVIEATGTRITATGEFPIRQTDFGIKPFSVGLGALEVVDQLQIRFKIVATLR